MELRIFRFIVNWHIDLWTAKKKNKKRKQNDVKSLNV